MMGAAGAAGEKVYVEDVFSTYLYTSTGSTLTIANGIDLANEGGLVWTKGRNSTRGHWLYDTERGTTDGLSTTVTSGNLDVPNAVTAFNSDGYTLGTYDEVNSIDNTSQASWTFRKAEKFFDVVTYTGTGANQTIAHNLGTTVGTIITKRVDASSVWGVYHRSLGATQKITLNETTAAETFATYWNNTEPTDTEFTVGTNSSVNASGGTYVAYLFAHDAGGFGDAGTDNVISCGSFTTTGGGGGTQVDLGWEPQWILTKRTNSTSNWTIIDNMRGSPVDNTADVPQLFPDGSNAELVDNSYTAHIQNKGFNFRWINNTSQYIYIAIRRGPMKVPTDGTKVFQTITAQGDLVQTSTATFPLDMQFNTFYDQSNSTYNNQINDRLRGIGFSPTFSATPHLTTALTAAETTSSSFLAFKGNGMDVTKSDGWGTWKAIFYNFRRAPGFFDVVCYTGTGSNASVPHNLQAVPQLAIIKRRDGTPSWIVGCPLLSNTAYGILNDTIFFYTSGGNANFQNTAWSDQYLYLSTDQDVNGSGYNYVAYLFATLAGISKVGSYTGTGTTLSIDCGFTAGARFVLIKRTDDTGDWYVWDTARGIIAGNDPYLLLNSTAAEVTNTDYIDPLSSGFQISSTAPAAINAIGGTYIFLAIA
jgi:hypothetical protein